MIESLAIENYRVFNKFSFDGISKINLIVGSNNSGKSSLLEAIYLLNSRSPIQSLMSILYGRGEISIRVNDIREKRMDRGYLVSHIFNGHYFDKNHRIIIASNLSSNKLVISIKDDRGQEDSASQKSLFQDFEIDIESSLRKRLYIELIKPGSEMLEENTVIYDGLVPYRIYPRHTPSSDQNTRLISTYNFANTDLSALWDSITLTPREDKVIEALQILEPNVERLSLVGRQSYDNGVLLKIKGENDPIPLSSMGDGMRRILAIVTSLVSVDSGTLLIDEIDTGLHYGVLIDMWKLVFETAIRNNAQVFATTHSWDCVRAFQQAMDDSDFGNNGSLIRLDKKAEQINATNYSFKELSIAIKQDIEVR